jgi:hypothetical protein
MDAVKALAHRLETQTLHELTVSAMRAPHISPASRDLVFTPPQELDQYDDRDSGTGSDEDVNISSPAAATVEADPSASPVGPRHQHQPLNLNSSAHSNNTGLAQQQSTQTAMTSFYRVTSSPASRPQPIKLLSFTTATNPSSTPNSASSSFRPVSLVSLVPGGTGQVSDFHYWWSGLILPRDFPVGPSSSSLCSDDRSSTGSTSSCDCALASDRPSSEDEVDSTSTAWPAPSRVLRKRRGCPPGCWSGAGSSAGGGVASSDVDEEIQNILMQDDCGLRRGDVIRTASSTGCRACDASRSSSTMTLSQHKRLRHTTTDQQRPSLNLYKMQKLRIGRKSHCRRKMSLLHHSSTANRPRPLTMSNQQLTVAAPRLSKCLLPAAAASGVRAPAYYFRSLSHIRSSAVRRLPTVV